MAIPPPPTPAPTAEPPPAPPGSALRKGIWFVVILLTMMMLSLPTVIMVFLGMLPTLVAWVIDRSEGKHATYCVSGLNFSGLFPFLIEVWFVNHSTDNAISILTDVFNLMIIYGAAAFGWLLYIAIPPVVTTFLSVMSQHRMTILKTTQKNIVEEWGENVASTIEAQQSEETAPPPDAVPGP